MKEVSKVIKESVKYLNKEMVKTYESIETPKKGFVRDTIETEIKRSKIPTYFQGLSTFFSSFSKLKISIIDFTKQTKVSFLSLTKWSLMKWGRVFLYGKDFFKSIWKMIVRGVMFVLKDKRLLLSIGLSLIVGLSSIYIWKKTGKVIKGYTDSIIQGITSMFNTLSTIPKLIKDKVNEFIDVFNDLEIVKQVKLDFLKVFDDVKSIYNLVKDISVNEIQTFLEVIVDNVITPLKIMSDYSEKLSNKMYKTMDRFKTGIREVFDYFFTMFDNVDVESIFSSITLDYDSVERSRDYLLNKILSIPKYLISFIQTTLSRLDKVKVEIDLSILFDGINTIIERVGEEVKQKIKPPTTKNVLFPMIEKEYKSNTEAIENIRSKRKSVKEERLKVEKKLLDEYKLFNKLTERKEVINVGGL